MGACADMQFFGNGNSLCDTVVVVVVVFFYTDPSQSDMQYTTTIYPSMYIENDPLLDMNLEPRHGLSWPIAAPIVRLPLWRTTAKPL